MLDTLYNNKKKKNYLYLEDGVKFFHNGARFFFTNKYNSILILQKSFYLH